MTAVLRYQLALLVRSHRWLPPALLYAVLVVAGDRRDAAGRGARLEQRDAGARGGMLSTAVIAVTAIGASISPANAAIRAAGVAGRGSYGLPVVPIGLALALTAVAWAASVQAAARRSAG